MPNKLKELSSNPSPPEKEEGGRAPIRYQVHFLVLEVRMNKAEIFLLRGVYSLIESGKKNP
jgi:hypothetical protein